MFRDDHDTPRGLHYVRACIALAIAGNSEAEEFAAHRWGPDSGARFVTRAAVGATGGSSSALAETDRARDEFIEAVRGRTCFDQLPGVRYVPKGLPVVVETSAAVARWRKQGQAAVVTSAAFDRQAIWPLSLHALAVFSSDVMRDQSPMVERGILRTMVAAIAAQVDAAAFDPTNGGTADKTPASLTYAAESVASVNDAQGDIENALANFSGELDTAAWIAHPRTLAIIGLRIGDKGAATDVGALGGRVAGLPALACEQLSADSNGVGPLILLDGASVTACDEGIELMPSTVGMVEMDDAPAQDSLAPAAPTGAVVSLFQTDSVALKATRRINWRLARSGACVWIQDADYAVS